jgi:transglutaminase-like putative cysteine protease
MIFILMWLIIFLLFFLFCPKIFATNEFNISQQIQYQIDTFGNAVVTQQVELTNNYSQIYPKEYQITLSSNQINNITGSDALGNIIKSIDQQNESTVINIVFNQENTGKNKTTKFKLNYNIPSLAQNKGNTWEIALPENQSSGYTSKTEITIIVPSNFGNLSFASASPQKNIFLNNQTELYFQNISNSKILLIFGDYQLFDFKFKYFLQNNSLEKQTLSVAFPPETTSQKITYRSIIPIPKNINIDTDGNYLASYELNSNQKLEINIDGQAKIIHTNLNYADIKPQQYITSDIFWETGNQQLIQIANKLNNIKDIYKYIVNTLNYKTDNYDTSIRQGAAMAVTFPNSALCTEFTDLFITLSRIKGIPAREVEGFAYSNNTKIKPININTDILHAWPQYYDFSKKAWVSVDPTWEKTTNGIDYFNDLDPNHFTFVFHGLDSQQPISAGGYKNNQNIKTINVEFAKNELKNNQLPLTIKTISKSFQIPKIKITNPNYNSVPKLLLSIKSINFQQELPTIPPLSSLDTTLPNFNFFSSLNLDTYKINLEYNNQNVSFKIPTYQFYLNWTIIIASIATLVGLGGIIKKRKYDKKNR